MPIMSTYNTLLSAFHPFSRSLNLKRWGNYFCRLPVLLQATPAESGLTCLQMVAHYYGKSALFKTALQPGLRRTDTGSTNLVKLIGLACQMQLSCRPLRIDLQALFHVTRPIILVLKHKHYVVLKHCVRDQLYLHDPAHGSVVLSRQQVALVYSGVALEIAPMTQKVERSRTDRYSENLPADAVNASGKFSLRSLLARHPVGRRQFYLVLILMLLTEAIILTGPYLLQVLFDQVLIDGNFGLLPNMVIAVLCLGILYAGAMCICSAKLNELETRLQLRWRLKKIRSFLQFSEAETVAAHTDELMSLHHVTASRDPVATIDTMMSMLRAWFGLAALGMLMLYDLRLALLTFSGSALLGLLCQIASPKQKNMRCLYDDHYDHQQLNVLATLRRLRSVHIFNRLSRWKLHHHQQELSLASIGLEILRHQTIQRAFKTLVLALQTTLVLWMGCVSVQTGSLTLGMFSAAILYFAHYMQSVYRLIELTHAPNNTQRFKKYDERMTEIVSVKEKILAPAAHSPSSAMNRPQQTDRLTQQSGDNTAPPSIALRQISFRYADHAPWVLNDLNVSLDEGEALILAGRSGSGKSTLFKLLLGEIAPQEGTLYLRGKPVSTRVGKNTSVRWAAVLQGDQLSAGSISENIAWLEDLPRPSAIEYCARLAQIHEEIMRLPAGYATHIDAVGAPFSGGQIQRLLIARALYHEPEILLLDEATSCLDAAMENKIVAAIASLRITRIIISQRLATSGYAGRILHLSPTDKAENLAALMPKQGTPVA